MKLRLTALLVIATLLGAVTLTPAVAGRASAAPPVGGTMALGPTGALPTTLTGAPGTAAAGTPLATLNSITITGFQVINGVLSAVGTANVTVGSVTQTLNFVAGLASSGACQILDLTIGPINLDLLGLVVTTNAIHLNITAQSGPGNLLGNLLCAVANLLNGNGPTGLLARLLNQLLPAGGLTL
jgi:hypothetical protein